MNKLLRVKTINGVRLFINLNSIDYIQDTANKTLLIYLKDRNTYLEVDITYEDLHNKLNNLYFLA